MAREAEGAIHASDDGELRSNARKVFTFSVDPVAGDVVVTTIDDSVGELSPNVREAPSMIRENLVDENVVGVTDDSADKELLVCTRGALLPEVGLGGTAREAT